MTKEEFERKMRLRIICEDAEAITQLSLQHAVKWNRIVQPTRIYLFYQEEPWDFLTYVVDDKGWAIRYSGFSWGYAGEGPHGLMQLIKDFGWAVPNITIEPEAHVPGAWIVTPDGKVKVEWLPTFPLV